MASVAVLYTPDVLAAAMELAQWPWRDDLPLTGSARSRACGSALDMGLALDDDGNIAVIGLRPHACAVGQAAARVFVGAAAGRSMADITAAQAALAAWLADAEAPEPDWPGIGLLRTARGVPGRHGAIMLAWDAALAAMAKAG